MAIAYSNNELAQDLVDAGANVNQRAIGKPSNPIFIASSILWMYTANVYLAIELKLGFTFYRKKNIKVIY